MNGDDIYKCVGNIGVMNRVNFRLMVLRCIAGAVLFVGAPAHADSSCFASSKIYRIHPLRGGPERMDGWSVKADAFAACVHRAEAADNSLHGRYPETLYALSLASTIGCHAPCG